MGEVTAYGRKFNFDDGVSESEQQRRIQNWMQMHAKDELTVGARAADEKPAPARTEDSGAQRSGWGNVKAMLSDPGKFWGEGRGKEVARDTGNYWRTVGQGMVPVTDEALAGIRSLIPGGADYDTNLADERARLKEYGDKHGETAKVLTELGGAAATIPLTMGAGLAVQGLRTLPYAGAAINAASKYSGAEKLAEIAAKYPKIATVLGVPALGGAAGAVQGFGAGEGGFENRAENAANMAPVGAGLGVAGWAGIRGLQGLGQTLFKSNRVADFLRKRLPQDRGDAYNANPNIPRNADGTVNVNHPSFANMAGDELDAALRHEQNLSNRRTDVMTADVLPSTTESILLHPGENTSNLRRQIVKRQYDPTLPEAQAAAESQYGHVGKWFDRVFGSNKFRDTEEAILAQRARDADTGFAPAYRQNTITPELENAYLRAEKLHPEIIKRAQTWAETEGTTPRSVGWRDTEGNLRNYNLQYLHDIKRSIDKQIAGDVTFDKVSALKVKNDLNEAMKAASPEYKAAMEKYGEHSNMVDALRQGRETVFGKEVNEIDKGIGKEDIIAFLNDPTKSEAEKEMFRTGAVRALRQNLLGSDAKKFTHNWADALNSPNLAEKYKALVDPSEAHLWDTMREQLMQLTNRRKALESSLGNSKTATRQQMVEELNQPNVLSDIVATGVNPHAPSAARNWVRQFTDPKAAGRATANEVAKMVSGMGPSGNRSNVQQIRDLLSRYYDRNAAYDTAKKWGPGIVAAGNPFRQWNAEDNR